MKVLILFTLVVVGQVQSATKCPAGTLDCAATDCPHIHGCPDHIQPEKTDCNCCAYCRPHVGKGEKCYSKYGTKLQCQDGLICSSESKTCIRRNICYGSKCPYLFRDCEDEGMKFLPPDPSKCRCCLMCGHDEEQTGCEVWQNCNSETGVCENPPHK